MLKFHLNRTDMFEQKIAVLVPYLTVLWRDFY